MSKIQPLMAEFATTPAQTNNASFNANDAANWLQKKQLLTSYQARILLAGHKGPIRFGDYLVMEPFTSTPTRGDFRGKHFATNFPVRLQFMAGTNPTDLDFWNQIEALSEKVSSLDEPTLVAVFESVVLTDYRFVVSEASPGRRLSELLPRKGRMPWPDACVVMAHVAKALNTLHQQEIVHNAISPRVIWVESGGKSKLEMSLFPDKEFETPANETRECRLDYLAPEVLSETPHITARSDLYAFGCTLYRIIAGKTVFPVADLGLKSNQHLSMEPVQLDKYNIPPQLQELLDRLLDKDPERRPQSATSIASQLCHLAGKPDLLNECRTASDEKVQAFRARINRNRFDTFAVTGLGRARPVDFGGQLQSSEESTVVSETIRFPTPERVLSVRVKRKNGKWKMPLAVAAALILMSGLIGLFAYQANRTALVVSPDPVAPDTEQVHPVPVPTIEVRPTVNPNLVQVLIDDDDASLWESPTTGPPLDLAFHPPTSRIIFAFRPAELLSHLEGRQLLRSLGPVLNQRISDWSEQLGLEFDIIEQLIVSLHPGQASTYDSFASIKLTRPTTADELIPALGNPTAEVVGDATIYKKPDGTAFYFLPTPPPALARDEAVRPENVESTDDELPADTDERSLRVLSFVFGKPAAVRAVAESGGLNVTSGTMKKLIDRSDADRHFSFLFLRPAMFNEQGQTLMGPQLATLNRQLDLFLQDEIRGGVVSFHIDQGDYFEVVFDQTVDLESRELKESLQKRLRVFRDEVTRYLATIPANAYWDKVRLRYDNMLADVYRNLRWDVEFGTVIGNCWLPPMAGHNLVAASELITAFSGNSTDSAVVAATKKVPATLEELLQSQRSLRVTTNPDLNVLLNGIRAEILDEFGALPFDFHIRLVGNDLQKEGITQNQRPGDFELVDKSLAEILTEIMVRCNPDKSISGSHDPNCKLVWVLGPDPADPGKQAILITTRAGVSERNLKLPENFQPQ